MTVDACANPGACDANCTHSLDTVACYDDNECDDGDPDTIDTCVNAGRESSFCDVQSCTVECRSGEDCGDNNAMTTDACSNPGECDAACVNAACSVACASDFDCDDGDVSTLDKCKGPGVCAASCAHTEQMLLSIEMVTDLNRQFLRGETISLEVVVKDANGNLLDNANISLEGPDGGQIDLNSIGNGHYAGLYYIPPGFELGTHEIAFLASDGGMIGRQELMLDVNKGLVRAVLVSPANLTVPLGEKLEFKFKLVYDNNALVENPVVSARLNGTEIALQSDGNLFTGYYLFSEKDLENAILVVSASDEFGNGGATSFEFEVIAPIPLYLILIPIAAVLATAIFLLLKKHDIIPLKARAEIRPPAGAKAGAETRPENKPAGSPLGIYSESASGEGQSAPKEEKPPAEEKPGKKPGKKKK